MKYGIPEIIKQHSASRPARGAWIEMLSILPIDASRRVAPREGRVD